MRHLQKNLNRNSEINVGGKPISFSKHNQFFNSILPTSVIKKHETEIFVHKKKRPISRKGGRPNSWNLQDAERAIQIEQLFLERSRNAQSLVIKFPDQRISPHIVQGYSANIGGVKFIQSVAPRYCYVTLKPGADVQKEIKNINKIPFQNGFLKAQLRSKKESESPPVPLEVDPTTLYVGNLPPDVSVVEVKARFPNARQIEIGYSLKRKWRRYALVEFKTANEALHAFKKSFVQQIRGTSMLIRFHRVKHWKKLEELELQNEMMRVKIKKEKEDAEYEKVLQRAEGNKHSAGVTQMAPARFPIARPFLESTIIKQEPISPNHEVNENFQLREQGQQNPFNQLAQYHQLLIDMNKQNGQNPFQLSQHYTQSYEILFGLPWQKSLEIQNAKDKPVKHKKRGRKAQGKRTVNESSGIQSQHQARPRPLPPKPTGQIPTDKRLKNIRAFKIPKKRALEEEKMFPTLDDRQRQRNEKNVSLQSMDSSVSETVTKKDVYENSAPAKKRLKKHKH